ncbi:MAG: DUF4097 family beta strand repeat-containing protein [Verrucomicrobiota bacterium]
MFTILRNSFVLFVLTLTASAASKEDVSRQVDVKPGEKLVVEVDFGTIDVTAGGDNKVILEAHRKIDFGNESKEKKYLANTPITVTKDGNVVTIRSRGKKTNHWIFGHQEMDAKYTVRIPKRFEVGLHTDGGPISVTNIAGNLKAHTSGGDMTFAHLEGTLDAQTSGGAIEVEDCRGPIDIETSGGDIKVADGNGGLNAHTSGGRIDVRNFSGDTEVRTSGGNLTLEKISGKLVGKTSGGAIRASIPGAVAGDIRLETSAGNIDLAVPASAALTIDANTSVGKVVTRLPIEGSDVHREHLRGTLNGGGKSVRLETSAGNITIKPASSELVAR